MAYCCQCGNPVADTDVYCAKCGTRQPSAGPGPVPGGSTRPAPIPIPARTASILCYIPFVGWVAAIVVLASDRFRYDRTVRFHAFQGLYLFVAWLFVSWVVGPFVRMIPGPGFHFGLSKILELALLAVWIFMMVKTSQEQVYSLPIVGELAERSVSES